MFNFREFEINYRLSFHCSLLAARDRKKILNLKNQVKGRHYTNTLKANLNWWICDAKSVWAFYTWRKFSFFFFGVFSKHRHYIRGKKFFNIFHRNDVFLVHTVQTVFYYVLVYYFYSTEPIPGSSFPVQDGCYFFPGNSLYQIGQIRSKIGSRPTWYYRDID